MTEQSDRKEDRGAVIPDRETKPLTPERVDQIIKESMKNKNSLNRYMSSQFELSPRGSSLRLKGCPETKS